MLATARRGTQRGCDTTTTTVGGAARRARGGGAASRKGICTCMRARARFSPASLGRAAAKGFESCGAGRAAAEGFESCGAKFPGGSSATDDDVAAAAVAAVPVSSGYAAGDHRARARDHTGGSGTGGRFDARRRHPGQRSERGWRRSQPAGQCHASNFSRPPFRRRQLGRWRTRRAKSTRPPLGGEALHRSIGCGTSTSPPGGWGSTPSKHWLRHCWWNHW